MRPSECAVCANDTMFVVERALGGECLPDMVQYVALIVWMDVPRQPVGFGRRRIGYEVAAGERAHFAPVRTHSIHHVGTGLDERAEALLTLAQSLFGQPSFQQVGRLTRQDVEQLQVTL